MKKIKIVEIFDSIEGEGSLVGYPTTFIRLEGCNLRCDWCDTKYSYDTENYRLLSLSQIMSMVETFKNRKVCLTGGEPLFNEGFEILFKEILKKGYFLIVETNGTLFREVIKDMHRNYKDQIHIVCSPKPFSNYFINERLKPFINEIKLVIDKHIRYKDVLKFKDFYEKQVPIIFQPESNKREMFEKARKLQKEILIEEGIEIRIIPQYHKFLDIR